MLSRLAKAIDSLTLARYRWDRRLAQKSLKYGPPYAEYEYDRNKLSVQMLVGQGQFGKVYLAKLETMDGRTSTVAVKMTKGRSEEAHTDFLQEIEIMMALKHPNIITLLGICTTDFPFCIIMEFLSEVQ